MAHWFERAVVRAAGCAARGRARALPGAALLLTTLAFTRAGAQAPDAGGGTLARAGLPDAASWWGEVGRAGWMPEAWLGTAYPPALAGLVAGAWRLDEPGRRPTSRPWPGIAQARAPLGWYDSLEVRDGGGSAWDGFDGALAVVRGTPGAAERRARSTFSLANGSAGYDENALTVARGDSAEGLAVDVMSGTRGAAAGIERAARHRWGVGARLGRGREMFEACFAQSGAAARLAGGEEQAAAGRGGRMAWRRERAGLETGLTFTRGLDAHESFGAGLGPSRREGQETGVEAVAGRARAGRAWRARLEWREEEVKRLGVGASARTAGSLWGALGLGVPMAGGRLQLGLGAGRHGGVDRFDVAPAAALVMASSRLEGAVTLERLLAPVWSDLAPGQGPFLQRAWVGGLRAASLGARSWRARGSLRAGRAYSRALADRLPLEELWLRRGLRAEAGHYDFALAAAAVEWERAAVDGGLEGFGLARRVLDRATPLADPGAGFRAWLGARTVLFGGDLGVHLRTELEGVGAREATVSPARRLAPFVTVSVVGELVLGDAVFAVRVRNLEDRAREQSWVDSGTGRLALSGRRDMRLTLTWRLFN